MAFWDRRHGILLGDPVDGHFVVYTTDDGGVSWQRQQTPVALPKEGAFAASGTCLTAAGKAAAWFGTGGAGQARVFRSTDRGRSWQVAATPLAAKSAAAGIFSLAFRDRKRGVAVGGDYKLPNELGGTLATTKDGGQTWQAPVGRAMSGYRSGVTFVPGNRRFLIAVGSSGSDLSQDGGVSWNAVPATGLNGVGAAADGSVWAVGVAGKIAKLER